MDAVEAFTDHALADVTFSGEVEEYGGLAWQACVPPDMNDLRARVIAQPTRVEARLCPVRRFESLCAPQRENLLRYVTWLSRDIDAAQDIVQAALLRAWRSIHTLAEDRAVTAWLHTIARREVARFYARKKLDVEDVGALSRSDEMSVSHEDTMALEDLQFLLNSMKDADQQILFESICGYSSEEMAISARCSLAQARMRLFRARRRLRSLMV